MFLNAEAAIVWTLAVETLPARARGIGFGWLQMSNALGVGFGAIAFGGIIRPLDLSWRWLYVVGIPPLLLVARLRRRLPESERFEELKRTGGLERDWRVIFRPPRRRWILFVIGAGLLLNLSQQASSFAVDFLQTQRHLGATQASFMLVAATCPASPSWSWQVRCPIATDVASWAARWRAWASWARSASSGFPAVRGCSGRAWW